MNDLTVSEIKARLEKLNISQPEMAKAIKCNKDYLNRILCGRIEPTSRMLTKMKTFILIKSK